MGSGRLGGGLDAAGWDESCVSCVPDPVADGAGCVAGVGVSYGFGGVMGGAVVDRGDVGQALGLLGVAWWSSWAAWAFAGGCGYLAVAGGVRGGAEVVECVGGGVQLGLQNGPHRGEDAAGWYGGPCGGAGR